MSELAASTGRRILVVEDDLMIAMLVEDMLLEFGYRVVGPANTLADALALAEGDIDGAILDVNLGSQSVYPVADLLRARGVPMVFSSGYGDGGLRDVDKGAAVLLKPYRADELSAALHGAMSAVGASANTP